MVEDDGKQEEKFDFDSAGETLGYISLEQAGVLAMETARDQPGRYRRLARTRMAFAVVEQDEGEDYYIVTLSFRPEGEFAGAPGQEQFFITKEGVVSHRQVLSLPRPDRQWRLPVTLLVVSVAAVAAVIIGVVLAIGGLGGGDGDSQVAAPVPTSNPSVTLAGGPTTPVGVSPAGSEPIPTPTSLPTATPALTPGTATPTPSPVPTAVVTVVTAPPVPMPPPVQTLAPTLVPVFSEVQVRGATVSVLGIRVPVGIPPSNADERIVFQGLTSLVQLTLTTPPAELINSLQQRQ